MIKGMSKKQKIDELILMHLSLPISNGLYFHILVLTCSCFFPAEFP